MKQVSRQEGALPVVKREDHATIQDLYVCNGSEDLGFHLPIVYRFSTGGCSLLLSTVKALKPNRLVSI
jgi:hypothetical protein